MHFCSVCNNMYYLRIDEQNPNKLDYYCRNCGHKDTIITAENVCVSDTQIGKKNDEHGYKHMINEYTKLDPTLPRSNTIKCPNQICSSNKVNEEGGIEDVKREDVKREVINVRYDDTNMKYVYICAKCDTVWKTTNIK